MLAVFRDEPGAEVVLPLIIDSGTSSLNLSEVARKLFTEGWQREAIEDMFSALALRVFDLDLAPAIDAAEMESTTRRNGLSTADRVCLALAKRERAVAITSDRNWVNDADAVGVEVRLIR
jgi:PIN domain nuclease of toxin-antitoxin system